MANLEIPTTQREFLCEHCKGKVSIPRDLPPTTGPCPYCSEDITSPAPELPTGLSSEPHYPSPVVTPAAVSAEIFENPRLSTPEPPKPEKQAEPQAPSRKHGGLGSWMLGLLALTLLAGGIGYFALKKPEPVIPPPTLKAASVNEANYLRTGWQKDASQLLRSYLAAKSPTEKLPVILNGKDLATVVGNFYHGGSIQDSDIPADSFVVNEMTEEDRKRGIFMMVYTQPSPAVIKESSQPLIENSGKPPLRTHAFFKRTADGLKLDWEIFVQTKYRTLKNFVDHPKIGQTGVFRVLVMEDVPDKAEATAGKATYRIVDPANTSDTARVSVKIQSDAGQALSSIHSPGTEKNRPVTRTATVELKWSGEPNALELEISRLVCWEFLGLGGQEIPTTTATK